MNSEFQKLNALGVFLHDRRIGIINRLAGDQHIFSFEQDYADDPNRPTLSLSYKGRAAGIVTTVRPFARRLPPFFSNLLPEGQLRDYLAEKAGVKKAREFYLLAALGEDLPGAVVVKPIDDSDRDGHADEHRHDDEDRQQKNVLRFSLAGVQLKFSAILETSGGLTIPAHGVGGSWIVKLPSTQYAAVPENEFAMLELARAAGIQVPSIRLIQVADIAGLPAETTRLLTGNALAIERFDRGTAGRRVHMEDFAQVFGLFPDDKYGKRSYANIASVLWAETGEAGTYEFVRRVVFSVLIGNGDMHLKNWSLLYPDGRTPVLSPAYDFVSTVPYIPGDSLALSFGGAKSLDGIGLDEVRRFADTARLPVKPVLEIARETVERTHDAWKKSVHKDLIPAAIRQQIDGQIKKASAGTEL